MNIIELMISVTCVLICLFIGSIIPITTLDGDILLHIVGIIFIIHVIIFIPSYILKTEKYFDITGTIAYLSIIFYIFYKFKLNSIEISFQSKMVSLMVLIWALRLGIFLFIRIKKFKNDSRFDDAKKSFFKFLRFWMISSLWVFITTINAITLIINNQNITNNIFLIMGLIIWIIGFLTESIADYQKYKFKKLNQSSFISSGIWAYSQHPNYFGEITLWIGIFIISIGSLNGIQFVTIISPIFIYLLLTKISGINLLEESAKAKWGNDINYNKYTDNTPKLMPNFFKRRV